MKATCLITIAIITGFILPGYTKLKVNPMMTINDTSKIKHLITKSKDGTVISFWKSGSGPSLLFVHGTTADHGSWYKVSPYLEKHYTVYTMDRRGRGKSGDAVEYDLTREAEDIKSVVESIGDNVTVFGHSYGGLCSLEATLHSDKISKLILYEPPLSDFAPPVPAGFNDRIKNLVKQGELEKALQIFYRDLVGMTSRELEAMQQSPVWPDRVKQAATIPREMTVEEKYNFEPGRFTGLRIPVLLLLGGESPPSIKNATHTMESALPNAQIVILPGQQHIANYTAPDLLAEEIKNFAFQDALKMQAKVSGEGKPLVLVGGGLTGWSSWEPFTDHFTSKNRKVILLQLLNVQYGVEKRDLPANYSVGTESQAMAATLDSLDLPEPFDMVAWSYGSLITLDYALNHPERIRTLTLIEPPAFWVLHDIGSIDKETQQMLYFMKTMKGDITEDMLADFIRKAGLTGEGQQPQDLPFWENWVHYRQSLKCNAAILAKRDKLDRLGKLKTPVLFISGIGSPGYYAKIEKTLVSRLPDARIIELEGAHASHIVSRDKFLTILETFQK